ncbi:MAG: elongation factor 1-beta [Candidatus Micrarchaeia archaeon]
MGEVQLSLKVMPSDMDGFDKLKQDIMNAMKDGTGGLVKKCHISEQDIAFGMKALMLTIIMPDAEGGADLVEKKISEVENVSSCEMEGMDRL